MANATELTAWPQEQAQELNTLIAERANKGDFAVFDMDNTTYKNDLEESLIPYLENKGILKRENIPDSLVLIRSMTVWAKKKVYTAIITACAIWMI
ncbi:Uncharacterised protein [Serratia rubidaea]|uniref:Uncharacterized protein n=1 Tax=Serratia rubidaea TaxID=61652 RepID=A0A447QHG7_SERRU|nr:Uncharacterised protein [Serratia rubidaea]